MKRRNPFAPRVRKDERTGRWVGRCGPCQYTLSADHAATAALDMDRHARSVSHAEATVVALANALAAARESLLEVRW